MKNSFSFFLWLTKEGPPVLSVASVPSDLPFRRMTSYTCCSRSARPQVVETCDQLVSNGYAFGEPVWNWFDMWIDITLIEPVIFELS